MKNNIVIRNAEDGQYLSSINVGMTPALHPLYFRGLTKYAIHFENKDEAKATIKFIGDVLDWELEEQLEIVELQEEQ